MSRLVEASSFRDPRGYVYTDEEDGKLHRHINKEGLDDFNMFNNEGLCGALLRNEQVIPHEVVDVDNIIPNLIPFISYPYEWCFSQLKDAALLTLKIERTALEYGMTMIDASAYNVQFLEGKPIIIDTLSFSKYKEGKPWVAYKQFCQHFLNPLALASKVDLRLLKLSQQYIDGIPSDLTTNMLPISSFLSLGLIIHVHLHSRSQSRFANRVIKEPNISKKALIRIIEGLYDTINNFRLPIIKSEWSNYIEDNNYNSDASQSKTDIINEFIGIIKPKLVWDLGCNGGWYSSLCDTGSSFTVAMDYDYLAVEHSYKHYNCRSLLPLVVDITNPSPSIGWYNKERKSLIERGKPDTVMALALVHHLSISNNLSFDKIAEYLCSICTNLIIEFVPRDDSQIIKMLATREDKFEDYNLNQFNTSFSRFFSIIAKRYIEQSGRSIYLMKVK